MKTQTINIINAKNKTNKKLLAVCNINYDTSASVENVMNAYEKNLDKAFKDIKKENPNANMSNVMAKATEYVMNEIKDFVVLGVNDNRFQSDNKNAINWELS